MIFFPQMRMLPFFRRCSSSSSRSLLGAAGGYEALKQERGLVEDAAQSAVVQRFEVLRAALADGGGGGEVPTSLYLYGGPGLGKTLLMDLFLDSVDSARTPTRRVHFHSFMLDVHARLHALRGTVDPLVAVGEAVGAELSGGVLCFDEFQVEDIADAVLVRRLFETVMRGGRTAIVATSNRAPTELYKNGINRHLFVPFVELVEREFDVIDMSAPIAATVAGPAVDYRHLARRDAVDGIFSHGRGASDDLRRAVRHHAAALLRRDGDGNGNGSTTLGVAKDVTVAIGESTRTLPVHSVVGDVAGCFTFEQLCGASLGAADFLAISARYPIVALDAVPQLTASLRNEALRFIILIDALYEQNVVLVLASDVAIPDLFALAGDRDVDDEDDDDGGGRKGKGESRVLGEGGSSGRSTTMIGDMEWSATGLLGKSMAELGAQDGVRFASGRAASRLVEMQGAEYLARAMKSFRK